MSTVTTIKVCLLTAIFAAFAGAALMRVHLNSAHGTELAKLDKACLNSVYRATMVAKGRKIKRQPVLVGEGFTKN